MLSVRLMVNDDGGWGMDDAGNWSVMDDGNDGPHNWSSDHRVMDKGSRHNVLNDGRMDDVAIEWASW